MVYVPFLRGLIKLQLQEFSQSDFQENPVHFEEKKVILRKKVVIFEKIMSLIHTVSTAQVLQNSAICAINCCLLHIAACCSVTVF